MCESWLGAMGRLRALTSHVTVYRGSASRLSRTWISGKSKRTHWQSSVSTTYNPLFNYFPSENNWKVDIEHEILLIIKMSQLIDPSTFIKRHSRKIGQALSLRVNYWSSGSQAWKIYNSALTKTVFTKISLSLNLYINLHKLLCINSRT